jgi:uncharacterized protein with GYD domain
MKEVYWPSGRYDIVAIVDAKDDPALSAFGRTPGCACIVRMQTWRVFNKSEFGSIIGKPLWSVTCRSVIHIPSPCVTVTAC